MTVTVTVTVAVPSRCSAKGWSGTAFTFIFAFAIATARQVSIPNSAEFSKLDGVAKHCDIVSGNQGEPLAASVVVVAVPPMAPSLELAVNRFGPQSHFIY